MKFKNSVLPLVLCVVIVCLTQSCSSKDSNDNQEAEKNNVNACGEYPNWETSPYVLPFPVGNVFRISQGNCTIHSHKSTLRYAYDIEMPFGSYVTAARDGVVHAIRMEQPDGSTGLTASNWIQIRHLDDMKSEYVHLKQFSNYVNVGDVVKKGDTLALTGNSGDVGTYPHLHFDISPCGNNLTCGTEPVTFSNTVANPTGLKQNANYEAFDY